jgi:hypothetical protein
MSRLAAMIAAFGLLVAASFVPVLAAPTAGSAPVQVTADALDAYAAKKKATKKKAKKKKKANKKTTKKKKKKAKKTKKSKKTAKKSGKKGGDKKKGMDKSSTLYLRHHA